MSKPSDKKRQKQKEREKADAKRKQQTDEQRCYNRNFPRFVYRENGAPSEFVNLVKNAIGKIDFRDREVFAKWETDLIKKSKQHGIGVIKQFMQENQHDLVTSYNFLGKIGECVFLLIPEAELLKWIPYNDVAIELQGQTVLVTFRSLQTAKTPKGTVYYSRHKPTIDIDGQKKIVAFSNHAIQRICERISPRWKTYVGLGDAFAYFDQCVYFERCELADGQLAFTFFDKCCKGSFYWKYVAEILGEDVIDDEHYYHRTGYCPAAIEDRFIVGKTLLYPGYRQTPEHRLVWASDVPLEVKRFAKDMDAQQLEGSSDFRLLKFFHERGVLQVIHEQREIFKP